VCKRLGKQPLRILRSRYENNIEMDLRKIMWGWMVDGTGSGSCPSKGFGIGSVRILDYIHGVSHQETSK
jgi:aspartyl/asparaginyl-tRNA synthetase